jgi:hypothetical protein
MKRAGTDGQKVRDALCGHQGVSGGHRHDHHLTETAMPPGRGHLQVKEEIQIP